MRSTLFIAALFFGLWGGYHTWFAVLAGEGLAFVFHTCLFVFSILTAVQNWPGRQADETDGVP